MFSCSSFGMKKCFLGCLFVFFFIVACKRRSCDEYRFNALELRMIQDLDPVLMYVNADDSDTLKLISESTISQGPEKENQQDLFGKPFGCGARGNVAYHNSLKFPFFDVTFELNKQQPNAIEIPILRIGNGNLYLTKGYGDAWLRFYNEDLSSSHWKMEYFTTYTINGRKVEAVYRFTGEKHQTGTTYIYSVYEGLLLAEENNRVWKRIWQ